jgi:hypothetical protein
MAISKSHHTHKHEFRGEGFGVLVVEFLNCAVPEAKRRIVTLLLELKEAATYLRPARKGYFRLLDCRDRIKRINRRLARYQTIPILWSASSSSGNFVFEDVPASRNDAEYDECEAARALFELAKMNLLGSLRECKCEHSTGGRWFFAKFLHQKFCTPKCQIRWNASTEDAKKYRRDNKRENYDAKKRRDNYLANKRSSQKGARHGRL